MTAQVINVGNVFGAATVIKHFGYTHNGQQTDIVLVDHDGSNNRIYQFQGGRYTDLTGRIPAGKSAADTWEQALAAVAGKAEQCHVFVK